MTGNHVAILMGTYNGFGYLPSQLHSISIQTHGNWSLWISDDGSTDDTLMLLQKFKEQVLQPVHILNGPSSGAIQNFVFLMQKSEIRADYFAFCDQDDIWYPDKLERALSWLRSQPENIPNLYGGRTRLIDVNGKVIGYSPLFSCKPSFSNALVQSLAGGNTIVMNSVARNLLLKPEKLDIASHDWWAYILVSGAGGNIRYDPVPMLDYRQHDRNVIGSNIGWRARLLRLSKLLDGHFRTWSEKHIRILDQIYAILTPENRIILDFFKKARQKDVLSRLYGMRKSRISRQTILGNMGLFFAVLFKKL